VVGKRLWRDWDGGYGGYVEQGGYGGYGGDKRSRPSKWEAGVLDGSVAYLKVKRLRGGQPRGGTDCDAGSSDDDGRRILWTLCSLCAR
jgi:hypothetical protein